MILIASDAFQQTCQQDLRANERARLSTSVLAIGRRPIPRLAQSDHCSPKAKVTRSNRVGRTICQGFANCAAGSPLHRFQLSGHTAFEFHSFSLERRALRTGPSRLNGKRPNRRVGVAALRPARRVVRNGGIYVLGARARPMTLSLGLGDRWLFLSSRRRMPSDSARVSPRR